MYSVPITQVAVNLNTLYYTIIILVSEPVE